jgi:hypothetical protein
VITYDITYEEAVLKAARLLGSPVEEMRTNSETLSDERGYRFWQPRRGGGSLYVDPLGAVMFAASSLTEEQAAKVFDKGTRTPEYQFDRRKSH